MKSVKKLLRYAVPGIALMLLFGFALACGGEPSTEEVSKVEKEEPMEEPAVEEEEKVEEEIIEEDGNNGNAKIEYEIIYTLNHLRYDGAITYYVLIDPIDLSDDSFKEHIKEIIRKIVEEKDKKISIELFDKRSSLENGYKDGKFDEAMDLEEWKNWFTDEIINDLAIHSIATYDGELENYFYLNTLSFFTYSDYAENTAVHKYEETIEFNP